MDYESNKSGDAPSIDQSMEKKQISDQLPPLSANYSWLVSQNLDAQDDNSVQSFYTTHDPLLHYHCKIPELLGRRIRGCFYGWVILSNHPQNVMWSLWNPLTSKLICLPPLIHINGDFDDVEYCCLSSPPDCPNSVLLLTRIQKPNIVFFRFDRKRKRSKWTEMSYAKQLQNKDDIICCPTCCNGKVYALTLYADIVIQVDIVLNDKEVVISLLPLRKYPFPFFNSGPDVYYLKGFGTELFCIIVGFDAVARNTLSAVCLYKLDMTSTASMWEEIEDLKDAVFFVDPTRDNFSVFYNPEIPTKFGGYVHIRGQYGNRIYSYHVKDKTVSLTPMACLFGRSYVSLWECRLEGDDGEGKGKVDYKQEEYKANEIVIRSIRDHDDFESNNMMNESHLLDIPFHFLEKLMEFCVGIEYLKFRATCKLCNLAAPMIQWRNEAALKKTKWQTYSLVSPWLMVLEDNRGIMSFTDPVFGDKYFIKTLPVSIHDNKLIFCSRYGWLLFYCNLGYLVFFNPFTSDVRKLPTLPSLLENLCFSSPPTSADCVVVGFSKRDAGRAYILRFADQNPLWLRLNLSYGDDAPYTFCFTTFFGRDLYCLCKEGKLVVFKRTSEQNFSLKFVVAKAPKPRWDYLPRYFLVKRDEHLLLVSMGEFGHHVDIFQLNDSTKDWMKVDCIGRHVIYICGATCLCIEAKTPKMQNKIFFPRLHCEDGKIVFYSLKTRGYHTFDSQKPSWSCLRGTKYLLYPHAWIEPSWY